MHWSTLRPGVRGFSLMELLTAIAVLAVGMLGVVALYMDRVHQQKRQPQALAASLVQEMAVLIRERTHAASRLNLEPGLPCTQMENSADAAVTSAACWSDKVAAALPNGIGMVERQVDAGGYRVTVSWSEAGVGAATYVAIVDYVITACMAVPLCFGTGRRKRDR